MEVVVDNVFEGYKIGLSGVDEIIQNVKVILNTRKGSVPLDRDFGVDWSIVDTPNTLTLQRFKADIVDTVEKYEPRVKVKKVEVLPDESLADGVFKVRLFCEIIGL